MGVLKPENKIRLSRHMISRLRDNFTLTIGMGCNFQDQGLFYPVLVVSVLKLLLIHSYHSTDFEVHRNWLAITSSLPIAEWYKDETSPWTLDYPPLFAWYEYILSKVAYYFDPKMLSVGNLNYASSSTVLFQRLSVILTDLIFAYSISECIQVVKNNVGKRMIDKLELFIIIFGNAGLFLVDHIHFQYNGFLYGVMFLSIARILQKREIEGAMWFSILLNLKHIYLYIAPAYFVYLLRSYCLSSGQDGRVKWLSLSIPRLAKLSSVVLFVFLLSFGPFIAIGQLNQVISRLFPFKRGLSHAYWAPNFWAFYNFADKVLAVIGKKLGFLNVSQEGHMTGGLVQEFDHVLLPIITPLVTFIITFMSMVPCLIKLWSTPKNLWMFIKTIIICGFCSFLFGWHVHEKAILLVILPYGLLCLNDKMDARIFLFLSIVGHFSLFPLIFTHQETVIKVTALLLHACITGSYLQDYWKQAPGSFKLLPVLSIAENIYLFGLIPLFFYEQIVHKMLGLDKTLPFLPLMLISVYCSIGVLYSWIRMYYSMFSSASKRKKKIK